MDTEKKIEDKILDILSKEILSVSQLAKKLKVKRYLLSGYLEALREQGKVESFVVGRAKVYVAREKFKKNLGILLFFSLMPIFLSIARAELITSFYPSDKEAIIVKFNGNIIYYDKIASNISCTSKPTVIIRKANTDSTPTIYQKGIDLWGFELPSYILASGRYSFVVICGDNQESIDFSIKAIELTLVTPTSFYENQIIGLEFVVNSDIILNNSVFSFFINYSKANTLLQTQQNKTIILISDLSTGDYTFALTLEYSRVKVNFTSQIRVLPRYEVKITSISKTSVEKEDNITVNVLVKDRGVPIEVSSNNIKVYVNDIEAEILALRFDGNNNVLRVNLPNLEAGTYELKVVVDFGKIYYDKATINYIKTISGSVLDFNKRPVQTYFYLYKNNQEIYRTNTDNQGNYVLRIVPSTYDLKITVPQATLYFKDFSFTSEQNIFSHSYSEDIQIEGLKIYGFYYFDVTGSYSLVNVSLNYRESNVEDEDSIKVYYCENWNFQKSACNKNWVKVDNFVLSKVSNAITLSLNNLYTIVLGREKYLKVSCGTNKDKYYINETISINCLVRDEDGVSVKDSLVTLKILGRTIVRKTDEKGLVVFEFPAENEGNFTFVINAKKEPYVDSSFTSYVLVEKKKEVFVLIPDTIRIERGGSTSVDFTVYNTGQKDLTDVEFYLEGIGFDYVFNQSFLKILRAGESFKNSLVIYSNENASLGVSTIKFRLVSKELSYNKDIGLTVMERKQKHPTGFMIKLPEISFRREYYYLLIFAAISFSVSYFLKKIKKMKKKERDYSDVFNLIRG